MRPWDWDFAVQHRACGLRQRRTNGNHRRGSRCTKHQLAPTRRDHCNLGFSILILIIHDLAYSRKIDHCLAEIAAIATNGMLSAKRVHLRDSGGSNG
jgi:hypothetical protein